MAACTVQIDLSFFAPLTAGAFLSLGIWNRMAKRADGLHADPDIHLLCRNKIRSENCFCVQCALPMCREYPFSGMRKCFMKKKDWHDSVFFNLLKMGNSSVSHSNSNARIKPEHSRSKINFKSELKINSTSLNRILNIKHNANASRCETRRQPSTPNIRSYIIHAKSSNQPIEVYIWPSVNIVEHISWISIGPSQKKILCSISGQIRSFHHSINWEYLVIFVDFCVCLTIPQTFNKFV